MGFRVNEGFRLECSNGAAGGSAGGGWWGGGRGGGHRSICRAAVKKKKKKHVHERAVAPYVAVAVGSSRVLVAAAESLPW